MNRTDRIVLAAASLLGLLAIVAGAVGAHPPEDFFASAEARGAWYTAVWFQLFHVLAVLAVSGLGGRACGFFWARALFLAGTVLFSGSIFALSLGGPSFLGPVTPVGGVVLIAGWLVLFLAFLRPARAAD